MKRCGQGCFDTVLGAAGRTYYLATHLYLRSSPGSQDNDNFDPTTDILNHRHSIIIIGLLSTSSCLNPNRDFSLVFSFLDKCQRRLESILTQWPIRMD